MRAAQLQALELDDLFRLAYETDSALTHELARRLCEHVVDLDGYEAVGTLPDILTALHEARHASLFCSLVGKAPVVIGEETYYGDDVSQALDAALQPLKF